MGSNLSLIYGQTQLYSVRFTRVVQKAVYQGPDYLYTQKEVYGIGYLNANTVNFSESLSQGQGTGPYDFDHQYVNIIENPRQRLRIGVGIDDSGDTNVIESVSPAETPTAGDALDVQNGPEPIYFDIVSPWGQKTCQVEFGFKWSVVTDSDASGPQVISNRWDSHQEYGYDQRLVITTSGRAVFRSDALLDANKVADDYRGWLVTPVPDGFRRTLKLGLSQDGLVLTWVATDTQQTLDAVSQSVVEMNVKAQVVVARANRADFLYKQASSVLERTDKFTAAYISNPLPYYAEAKLAAANASFAGANALLDTYTLLPRTNFVITCEIKGTPDCKISDLVNLALDVLAEKAAQLNTTGAGVRSQMEVDFNQRILVATRSYDEAPTSSIFNQSALNMNAQDLGNTQVQSVFCNEAISSVYETGISKGPGQGGDLFGFSGPSPVLNMVAAAFQMPLTSPSDSQMAPPEAPAIPTSDSQHQSEPSNG